MLGRGPSKESMVAREKQVQYFKHMAKGNISTTISRHGQPIQFNRTEDIVKANVHGSLKGTSAVGQRHSPKPTRLLATTLKNRHLKIMAYNQDLLNMVSNLNEKDPDKKDRNVQSKIKNLNKIITKVSKEAEKIKNHYERVKEQI